MKDIIIILLIILSVYLFISRPRYIPNVRWDIKTLANGEYTYKEIVNILGAPDELDWFKGYAVWIDSAHQKVLSIGLNDKGGERERDKIIVKDFYIKDSLSNVNIENFIPNFNQLANFNLNSKGIVSSLKND